MKKVFSLLLFTLLLVQFSCAQPARKDTVIMLKQSENKIKSDMDLITGARQTEKYIPQLKGKNIGITGNHTSLIGKIHLVDSLLHAGIKVTRVFAPEHGFRGMADAGEKISNGKDSKTGIQMVSLYGSHNKPSAEDLKGIDVMLFDIQDVGARFYTFISTLHYVMEACAENHIPLFVLDRPNPNGFYIDGPVLDKAFSSFVGMDEIPVVHGLTVGEYAMMLNGEKWLKGGVHCDLTVVTVKNYTHRDLYQLPVKPSPNLPNMPSVYLYPTLCFFEGTIVSVGRGTDKPFQVIGYPGCPDGNYTFTPKSKAGAGSPMYENKLCTGYDVSTFGDMYIKNSKSLYLFWLKGMYDGAKDKSAFFTDYFNTLAGSAEFRKMITEGKTEEEIRKSWQPALKVYKEKRKKYLLYPDFE